MSKPQVGDGLYVPGNQRTQSAAGYGIEILAGNSFGGAS